MVADQGCLGAPEAEVREACEELVAASRKRDVLSADRAMTRLADAVPAEAGMPVRASSVLALAECLRARLELHAGHRGAARLSGVVALALVRSLDVEPLGRSLGRVLISTARLACDLGDVQVAHGRSREALAIAQASFGAVDPDTACAWEVLGEACERAGDPVGANAARRQAHAARASSPGRGQDQALSPEEGWLLSP